MPDDWHRRRGRPRNCWRDDMNAFMKTWPEVVTRKLLPSSGLVQVDRSLVSQERIEVDYQW